MVSCPCYWGCGTQANKVNWAFIAAAFVAGAILIGVGAGKGAPCFRKYADCVDLLDDTGLCRDYVQRICPLRTYTGLIIAGAILFIFAIPIMMCYFCCCARRPGDQGGQPATTVMATYPTASGGHVVVAAIPAQGPYPYPPPNSAYPQQPYGAQPYPGQPYLPQAYPAPGQPYPAPGPAGQPYYPGVPAAPGQQPYPAAVAPAQPYPAVVPGQPLAPSPQQQYPPVPTVDSK